MTVTEPKGRNSRSVDAPRKSDSPDDGAIEQEQLEDELSRALPQHPPPPGWMAQEGWLAARSPQQQWLFSGESRRCALATPHTGRKRLVSIATQTTIVSCFRKGPRVRG